MICICIKVLSLDAPSALKTFMEVNLGKKFFVICDIFLPLYFSCPTFMWKVCTKHLIYKNMYTHHSHRQNYYNVFFLQGKILANQPKLHHGTKQFVSKSGIDITNLQHFLCAFPINLTKKPRCTARIIADFALVFCFHLRVFGDTNIFCPNLESLVGNGTNVFSSFSSSLLIFFFSVPNMLTDVNMNHISFSDSL